MTVAYGTTTAPSSDALAFLQFRVGRFGLLAGALGLTFLLFRLVMGLAGGASWGGVADPSFQLHATAAAVPLLETQVSEAQAAFDTIIAGRSDS